MASSWFVATGQQALGQLQVFTTHNPTCLNGITISTPLYQSVEVPVQHGIYIYVIFWFWSGFMVDTLLVSPERSVFSWTPLTSHRWPTPKTANVWWFPAVNYHLFLECPLRSWCFADTLFLLHMMPLMTQWNCQQFWRIWLKGTPPKMDGLPTTKPQMLRLLPPTFL